MSQQQQSLESILSLHEHGISLMKQQQANVNSFKTTQEVLLKCLRQLKQHCAVVASAVSASQQQQSRVHLQVLPTPTFLNQEESTMESSSGAVFGQMLTVSIVETTTTNTTANTLSQGQAQDADHNVNLLAAVVFFNLGLLHHVKSLQGGSAQVRAHCQTKAVSFYQFCMSLVVKLTEECNTDEIDTATSLLAVFVGNNLACLWADMFAYTELHRCLEWTQFHAERYSLWCFEQQEEQQKEEEALVDTSFFLTNAMVWQHISSLASAAA